ncbi:MAG: PAS domain-containing protein [Ferrovibrio sp.]|uniref:PAS domain-containing protein n=1 Tax=Ferrovibrio sp. TaxID=1917215 RepID=UPI0026285206|nr:PAS domain-containing protein [Ferrovibrio sp.]MCW0232280.1 PAS domain-containing protein [Ferrovibrio sp.]
MNDAALSRPWLQDRRIVHLLEVWRSARLAPGLLPPRTAIDPVALGADLLPYVALVDATHGGTRFRFRLVGTGLVEHAGLDLSGHYIEELNNNRDYVDYINGLYRQTVAARLPVYSETRYRAPSGRVGLTRRLTCPLTTDGSTVNMFVATQVFETGDGDGDAPTYTYAASFVPGITKVLADSD